MKQGAVVYRPDAMFRTEVFRLSRRLKTARHLIRSGKVRSVTAAALSVTTSGLPEWSRVIMLSRDPMTHCISRMQSVVDMNKLRSVSAVIQHVRKKMNAHNLKISP